MPHSVSTVAKKIASNGGLIVPELTEDRVTLDVKDAEIPVFISADDSNIADTRTVLIAENSSIGFVKVEHESNTIGAVRNKTFGFVVTEKVINGVLRVLSMVVVAEDTVLLD